MRGDHFRPAHRLLQDLTTMHTEPLGSPGFPLHSYESCSYLSCLSPLSVIYVPHRIEIVFAVFILAYLALTQCLAQKWLRNIC